MRTVEVTWADITGISEASCLGEILERKLEIFRTVGYLLSDHDGVLRLASTILALGGDSAEHEACYRDVLLIPACVVKSIKYLEEARGESSEETPSLWSGQ